MPVHRLVIDGKTYKVGNKPGTNSKSVTHICVNQEIDLGFRQICSVMEELSAFDLAHLDAYLENEGFDYPDFRMIGWREMNEKEKLAWKTQREKEKQTKEKLKEEKIIQDQKELDRLKKEHPEWF